jgi:hypothetical protein
MFVHYRPVNNPKWYIEDLATAPLDGVAVALQEVIQRRGALPAEGTPKEKADSDNDSETGEEGEKGAPKEDENHEYVKLGKLKAARRSKKEEAGEKGEQHTSSAKVKEFIQYSKDGVVLGGAKALEATVRARGKFSARIEKHARTAHHAVVYMPFIYTSFYFAVSTYEQMFIMAKRAFVRIAP